MSIITTNQLKKVEIILPPIEGSVKINEIVRISDLEKSLSEINKMIADLNDKIVKLQNADLSQDSLIATAIANIANLKESIIKNKV